MRVCWINERVFFCYKATVHLALQGVNLDHLAMIVEVLSRSKSANHTLDTPLKIRDLWMEISKYRNERILVYARRLWCVENDTTLNDDSQTNSRNFLFNDRYGWICLQE